MNADLAADDQETLRGFAVERGDIAPLYDFVAARCGRDGALVRSASHSAWSVFGWTRTREWALKAAEAA